MTTLTETTPTETTSKTGAPSGSDGQSLFPYDRWRERLPELSERYRLARPYPHIHLEGLLEETTALELAREFPGPRDEAWIRYKHYNENKLGNTHRERFPPLIGRMVDEFNSPDFVAWLSELTGIPGLMPDPGLEGGGIHQIEPGGFLNVHADFTMHHHHKDWRRRCNLLVYLNEGWQESWGGALELWDQNMAECVVKIPPMLNHAVVFSTLDDSYHGHPEPLACPQGTTRRSLALYYYTRESDPAYVAKSTNYRARPGDGARRALIWLDKKLVAVYSKVKSRLGLADDFAGKVLGWFSRK